MRDMEIEEDASPQRMEGAAHEIIDLTRDDENNVNRVNGIPSLGQQHFKRRVSLHRAALKGDWESAQVLLLEDATLIRSPITEGGETALHIAALEGHNEFVSKLLELMDENDLAIENSNGSTALCFAAAARQIVTAKLMIGKNKGLAKIKVEKGITPLYMAALQGYEEMTEYLYRLSGFETWTPEDQIELLTTCLNFEFYGLALKIVEEYESLVTRENDKGDTPLQVLARKPLAFSRNTDRGLCCRIVNTILSKMKLKTHSSSAQCGARKLLDYLWDNAMDPNDIEMRQIGSLSKSLFEAAEHGNAEFLVELINRYPDFLYKRNESKHSIFHIAVLRRHVKVFNLLLDLRAVKDLIASYVDKDGNNMLHLAAMLAPKKQLATIPGAALQMQREVLWYKEIEKLIRPQHRKKENSEGQTPYQLFLGKHKELMKEGEKLMKQVAKSCMLLTILIATVAFTTAFTVPGGYDNSTGTPVLENARLFMVFPVSEAVATFSSLTSMLMFLSILTSRYSAQNFLRSLPFALVIGLTSLFFSMVAMMVLFCTCLLFFWHGWGITTFLVAFFTCLPVMFVALTYKIIHAVLCCTCGSRWLFRPANRLQV